METIVTTQLARSIWQCPFCHYYNDVKYLLKEVAYCSSCRLVLHILSKTPELVDGPQHLLECSGAYKVLCRPLNLTTIYDFILKTIPDVSPIVLKISGGDDSDIICVSYTFQRARHIFKHGQWACPHCSSVNVIPRSKITRVIRTKANPRFSCSSCGTFWQSQNTTDFQKTGILVCLARRTKGGNP